MLLCSWGQWPCADARSLQMDQSHDPLPGKTKRLRLGDMHEFSITDNDTAIIFIYAPVRADLTEVGGPVDGWMLDNFFQESNHVQSSSGRLPQHIPLNAIPASQTTRARRRVGCSYSETSSFDFYHMNSVEKDSYYLVSARCLFHRLVDSHGNILWTSSGPGHLNELEDLSDGAATNFKWQHHARWVEVGTRLSLFNNDNHGYRDPPGESHGMVIDLDIRNRARLHATYRPRPSPVRQATCRPWPMATSSSAGAASPPSPSSPPTARCCATRFGAEALFAPVSSYRVFKGAWTGRPAESAAYSQRQRLRQLEWRHRG